MKYKTFDEYLRAMHFQENQHLLDDDLPDAFDDWLSNIDANDIIDYAEEWGKQLI